MGCVLAKCKCASVNDHSEDDRSVDQRQRKTSKGQESRSAQNVGNEKLENYLYCTFVAERLNTFRYQEVFVDFTIKVNGTDFPAHKNVLAASCKFFKDFFSTSEDISYEIRNMEPSAVEDVLNFLYTGKCRLDQQNAASILPVAEVFGIQDLKDASEKHLTFAEGSFRYDPTSNQDEFVVFRENSSLVKSIREFQVEGLFCDVTLTTGCGKAVPVHKNILAAVSCYFQGLFRSDMKEVYENNVDLGIIDESVFDELLQFIYSGQICASFDNIKSLLQASDYLLIENLKAEIETFLKASSTVKNFWKLFALVKSFDGLTEANNDILQMACYDYWEVTESPEFLEITEEDMKFFLSNDDIVCSETQMLESLIRWYNHSRQQRQESFKNLLHFIHMCSIPDLYLKFLAVKEGINELLSYNGHRLREKVPLDDIKRTALFYNLALFGFTRDPDCPGNQLGYWLPFAGPWSFITSFRSLIHWRGGHPCVFYDNTLYLQVYDHVQLALFSNPLSARHFEISSLKPVEFTERLSSEINDCTAVPLASCIYLIGGTDVGYVAHKTVHRYNTVTQSWDCASSMQERRCYHCAVSYRERFIYVFGGVEVVVGNRCSKSTVEKYDPEQNSWSYVASMHQTRCHGMACVFSGKIFVIGGESEECAPKCEIYDPLLDEWQMGCFQMKEIFTLTLKPDTGTFRSQMFDVDISEGEPLEPKVCLPHKCYSHDYIHRPSITCSNGVIIVFDFASDIKYGNSKLRLPFYFVDPETGNLRILYSLPSWQLKYHMGSLCR